MTSTVTLVGYLLDGPVLCGNGELVTTFQIAVDRDEPQVLDVECRGWLAENVAASLRSSLRIVVVGTLRAVSCACSDPECGSVVVVAAEAAPSLHWATAVVSFRPPIYPPSPACCHPPGLRTCTPAGHVRGKGAAA
ncbi:MAG: hypothetical protein QOI20_553 [Acidimicrobiaceae bacterium]|jgi:hypothetical protein|nr:hypothetical protein [Acidimicrobiaceae bacterium]